MPKVPAKTPEWTNRLIVARNALAKALVDAAALVEATEHLELAFADVAEPDDVDFYVPTDGPFGLKVINRLDSGDIEWTNLVGPRTVDPYLDRNPRASGVQKSARRDAVRRTLALRSSIDAAIHAVGSIADCMDSQEDPMPDRWTLQAIGVLRKLRGAITWGHPKDLCPSALPMIQRGAIARLKECHGMVSERLESVKTAIMSNAKPRESVKDQSGEVLTYLKQIKRTVSKSSQRESKKDKLYEKYMPISFFPKSSHSKVRQAANAKNRKKKKLRKKTARGMTLYHVGDFQRNWPTDFEGVLKRLRA